MGDDPDLAFQAWLENLSPARRQNDARTLNGLFRRATGFDPHLWANGVVGYGAYDYTYASGRSGTWCATGFAPRAAKLSIYILPGYTDFCDILARLGPHTKGKSCVYITRLDRIDPDVLVELIRAGIADLATYWPVRAAP